MGSCSRNGIMSDHDKFVVAQTMYGEARGETPQGQEAVAWVIKNRANDPNQRYGQGYSGVAKKDQQFTCWNDHNRQEMERMSTSDRQTRDMMATAERVMSGQEETRPMVRHIITHRV